MAIITLNRGTRIGADALARCLSRELGYPVLSQEAAQETAAQLGVPAKDLQVRMEERPGVYGRASLLTRLYKAALRNALAEAAQDGNLVYHGVAGGLLLKDAPAVLSIRLVAPLYSRIQDLMAAEEMSPSSAEAYIREVDDSRARWVSGVYGEDIADPALYDLVLNLEAFSVEEACEVLCLATRRPEFTLKDEGLADFEDFKLAARVNLALLEDLGTQTLDLEAWARRGMVVVTGKAPIGETREVRERIVEIVRSANGSREVRLDIQWSRRGGT
jgi:cytidylate kinase